MNLVELSSVKKSQIWSNIQLELYQKFVDEMYQETFNIRCVVCIF